MKAAIFEQCGNPAEVLRVSDIPEPVPDAGQVLVKMLASPINPSDLLYIHGQYGMKPTLPAVPGFEGVGIVESGGGLLGWLRKGKRVVVINDGTGNWKEKTVVSARRVVPIPADWSDAQGAMFFVNPVTAWVITRSVFKVAPGDWLLQSAAGSALGRMVIRLGQRFGFQTINVVRRPEQVSELRAIGGTEAICSATESIEEKVRTITQGKGVRFAMDPVGGSTGSDLARCLAPGGQMLVYGLLSGEPITIDPRFLITGSKKIEGFWLTDWAKSQNIPTMLRTFSKVRRLISEGVLTTEQVTEYPLDKVREAVQQAAQVGRTSKVLLRIASR